MPNIILFDDKRWQQLLPLTFTRPVAGLRIGMDMIWEKWEHVSSSSVSFLTETYLSAKYPASFASDNLYIYGGIIPDMDLWQAIQELPADTVLHYQDQVLAARSAEKYFTGYSLITHIDSFRSVTYRGNCISIERPWHLFQYNDVVLRADFERHTQGKRSATISSSNTMIGNDLFVEEGANVQASILNSTKGPIYISAGAEIMEGSMIRGPFYLGKESVVKMGAKIYGATTIGPGCKVGGEINNSVLLEYSNKAHDGFLGNSVIGAWCNLGADTNNSNLKNNYAEVKLWDYVAQKFILTGLQFCGLIMGDHSKCGINTMINTGTMIGVNVNLYGDGFPRNFIPSFSWGGPAGFVTYKLKDALTVAEAVMARRNMHLDKTEISIITYIYELSEKHRKGQLIFLHR